LETTQELDKRNPKIQGEIKNSSITPILPLIRPTQEHPKKSSHSRNNPRKPMQTLARLFPSPIRLIKKKCPKISKFTHSVKGTKKHLKIQQDKLNKNRK
jgi:hypothetical protein